jgi:hypothetical protein
MVSKELKRANIDRPTKSILQRAKAERQSSKHVILVFGLKFVILPG